MVGQSTVTVSSSEGSLSNPFKHSAHRPYEHSGSQWADPDRLPDTFQGFHRIIVDSVAAVAAAAVAHGRAQAVTSQHLSKPDLIS